MAALFNLKFPFRSPKKEINLLPQEEFAASTKGRVLTWALNTFRIIVIITEVIVMSAFISRFWLDAKVADLNDVIEQNKSIIESTSDFENTFREIQKKTNIIAGISSGTIYSDILQLISDYLPSDTFLTSIAIGAKEARVKAVTPNEISVSQYITNLNATDKFGKITLTQLDTVENSEILLFDLKIEFKE